MNGIDGAGSQTGSGDKVKSSAPPTSYTTTCTLDVSSCLNLHQTRQSTQPSSCPLFILLSSWNGTSVHAVFGKLPRRSPYSTFGASLVPISSKGFSSTRRRNLFKLPLDEIVPRHLQQPVAPSQFVFIPNLFQQRILHRAYPNWQTGGATALTWFLPSTFCDLQEYQHLSFLLACLGTKE